jgi:iron complex outermembrane recepter protein
VRFSDDRWNASLSWTYMDDVYFEPSNDPDTLQEGYGLLNGSVEYRVSDAMTVAVYGKNILDEDYLIDAGNFGGSRGYPTLIEGTPANFQAVVRYAF